MLNQSSFFLSSLTSFIALAGQPLTQIPQPMHFLGSTFMQRPSSSIAPWGQTDAHPMHWMHFELSILIAMGLDLFREY